MVLQVTSVMFCLKLTLSLEVIVSKFVKNKVNRFRIILVTLKDLKLWFLA